MAGISRALLLAGMLSLGMANSLVLAEDETEQTPAPEKKDGEKTPPGKKVSAAAKPGAAKKPAVEATSKAGSPTRPAFSRRGAGKIPASAANHIQAIRREFETGELRKDSDYFTDTPDPEMSSDVVMLLLNRRHGTSEAMDAYVKWQLLSALPKDVSDQYVGELTRAYANAPGLTPRPGLTPDSRKALEQQLRRADDVEEVQKGLDEEVRRVEALNEPVLGYRDALLARLPATLDGVKAGFIDAYQRAQAGMDNNVTKVVTKAMKLVQDSEDPRELAELRAMVDEVRKLSAPKYFDKVEKASGKSGFAWKEDSSQIETRNRLADFSDSIDKKMHGGDAGPGKGDKRRRGN